MPNQDAQVTNEQVRLVGALREARAYPHETATRIEVIETHISWILLTGRFAYKVKKDIRLPFVDFSTLERRHKFCHEELRLNRRLAPEYYLDVVPIGGTPDRPRVGEQPAIEHAVRMKQFAADCTLDRQLQRGEIDPGQIRVLAERIARFHDGLEPVNDPPSDHVVADSLDELGDLLDGSRRETLDRIATRALAEVGALAGKLENRRGAGRVKECHGDLHLGNLVATRDGIVAFDALEFDVELRTVDVADEAAFPTMDFLACGRTDLGHEFLNRYLERTGDYEALGVLRHFLVKRALIRAKVHAIKAGQGDAQAWSACDRYLSCANTLLEPSHPLLVLTHGLSGSGKTTVGDALVARLPALRVRSDLERKRLHGLNAAERSGSRIGADMYAKSADNATYGVLAKAAEHTLEAGLNLILDASFLSRTRRDAMRALAARLDARCVVLDVQAPEAVLRERVLQRHARGSDASEATLEVLEHQLARHVPLARDEEDVVAVDTSGPIDYDSLARRLRALG